MLEGTAAQIRLGDFRSRAGSEDGEGDYSQHGEAGVINAVFDRIGVRSRTCVEFGANELRRYSNTYHLWTKGWRALLIEGDTAQFRELERAYAAHPQRDQQQVVLEQRYVAEAGPDSLDAILAKHDFPRDLDFVSIDVDGTDFHIWRGLKTFRPRLVCIEYNPSVPPHIDVVGDGRGNNVGSSALAMTKLGRQKGYSLVACVAWNAFFVEEGDARHFADAGNLDALFDYSYLRYAMQSYRGELFFSAPLFLSRVPLVSDDFDGIESASVPLGRFRQTPRSIAEALPRYYMRPLYLRYLRATSGGWKQVGRAALGRVRDALRYRHSRASRGGG